jgi:multiple sugar transport system permease protein
LISPTTFFVLIISIIGSFQVFEQTYILTQGGPAYSTLTISFYIYQQAFQWFHMGFGAALSYVLFVIILVFTLIQFKVQRRWVFYS